MVEPAKWMIVRHRMPDQRGDQRLVADIADDQLHPLGQRLGKSGREIVDTSTRSLASTRSCTVWLPI